LCLGGLATSGGGGSKHSRGSVSRGGAEAEKKQCGAFGGERGQKGKTARERCTVGAVYPAKKVVRGGAARHPFEGCPKKRSSILPGTSSPVFGWRSGNRWWEYLKKIKHRGKLHLVGTLYKRGGNQRSKGKGPPWQEGSQNPKKRDKRQEWKTPPRLSFAQLTSGEKKTIYLTRFGGGWWVPATNFRQRDQKKPVPHKKKVVNQGKKHNPSQVKKSQWFYCHYLGTGRTWPDAKERKHQNKQPGTGRGNLTRSGRTHGQEQGKGVDGV